MPDLMPLSHETARAATIKAVYNDGLESMESRNARIAITRQMLMGELRTEIPKEFEVQDKEKFLVRLPQGTTVPLKTVNVIQRKRPHVKRFPVGAGPQADRRSTKIERWLNSVMGKLLDWDTAVDYQFNEAEVLVVTLPRQVDVQKVPSLIEAYEERDRDTGKATKANRTRRMYQRDSSNRAYNDKFYQNRAGKKRTFEEDKDMSAKAYEEVLEDFRARNLPWETRVIPASGVVPIFGRNNELHGVVYKEQYRVNELIKKGLRWDNQEGLLQVNPSDQGSYYSAATPEVSVYTYIGYSYNGEPFVAYTVDGKPTRQVGIQDEKEVEADAVINLHEEFGLSRIPATYTYGWHFANQDPSKRGVPFVWPFIPSLLGADALASATVLHSWWTAFGGWFIQMDPTLDPRALLENGKPREVKIKPMTAQYVGGMPHPAVHPGVNQDVHRMIGLMMGATEQEMPGSKGGPGGAQATSGFDRSLMRDYLEDSVSQVLKGAREMYEYHASVILEMADHLAQEWDMGIPVYAPLNVGPQLGLDQKPNKTKITREILTLDPGDAGINFEVEAFYPRLPGENIALAQQLAEFVKQKLATFEEFRQLAFGDENPEETRILIAVDEMIFETPVGRNYIMQLAFEYMAEERQAQMAALIEQDLMLKNGMPRGLMEGLFPEAAQGTPPEGGGNPGNVMSGMGRTSPARQSMGGIVAGGNMSAAQGRVAQAQAAGGMGAGNIGG
jgi:hypothetical protein